MHWKSLIGVGALVVAAGCAGGLEQSAGGISYVEPGAQSQVVGRVPVSGSASAALRKLITGLNGPRYAITHVDRANRLLVVVYSGDPEPFVDCGRIRFTRAIASEITPFEVNAAQFVLDYEAVQNGRTILVSQVMRMDARAVVRFSETTETSANVGIRARYVLSKDNRITDLRNGSVVPSEPEIISFSSGGSASFKTNTVCRAKGTLESEILRPVLPSTAISGRG